MSFTIDEIIDLTESWLIKGDLNPDMLASHFQFISPFWKGYNKTEFMDKFLDPTEYKKLSLSNIIKFDPLLRLKDLDGRHFLLFCNITLKTAAAFGRLF